MPRRSRTCSCGATGHQRGRGIGIAVLHFFERPRLRSNAYFDFLLPSELTFDNWVDAPIVSPDGRLRCSQRPLRHEPPVGPAPREPHPDDVAGTEARPIRSGRPTAGRLDSLLRRELNRVKAAGGPWRRFVIRNLVVQRRVLEPGRCNPLREEARARLQRAGSRGRPQGRHETCARRAGPCPPAFLPDGRRFLYVASGARPESTWRRSMSAGGHGSSVSAAMAIYADPGYLLFTKGQTLSCSGRPQHSNCGTRPNR